MELAFLSRDLFPNFPFGGIWTNRSLEGRPKKKTFFFRRKLALGGGPLDFHDVFYRNSEQLCC